MGVEARCCPSKSAAHCRHMKRQPFLCNGRPCHGRCHCHRRRHLHCHRQLRCRRHHCCCCNHPSPSPLVLAIAIAVSVKNCCQHLCCIAISHCCHRRPCRRPLPSPSPSAIAVAISISHHHRHAVSHFRELLPWCVKNCIRPIEAKNAHLIVLCLDSGRHID
jgi:hypothetical protein